MGLASMKSANAADFLAWANLDQGDPQILLKSVSRLYKFLPGEQKHQFLTGLRAEIV